jgi:dihydroorotate dehydrogenase (fumarate)
VTIPVAVKLSPFFTALPHVATRLVRAGARGLALFNRFYQPDFDLETREVVPRLALSTAEDLRLPLRWIAMLFGRLEVDFALTSGVHTGQDVVKGLMAGARVAMLASELLAHGPARLGGILSELEHWMEEHACTSVAQLQGSMSQQAVAEPAAFERAHYLKVLDSFRTDVPRGEADV